MQSRRERGDLIDQFICIASAALLDDVRVERHSAYRDEQ